MAEPSGSRIQLDDAADEVLADRAADGDANAFAVLVRRYSRLLRSYARRVLGSQHSPDDVVQEALITAWQQLPKLEDRSAVRGWLVRITTRKALDLVRSHRQHDDVDDTDPAAPEAAGPAAAAQVTSINQALDAALLTLPIDQQRAWTLRELADYSYDEIAAELDLPVSTVRGLLARARRTLIRQMEGWR